MNNENFLLSTPIDPKMLDNVLNKGKEIIRKVSLVSIDFPTIEIFGKQEKRLRNNNQTVFHKNQDQSVMFDVVGIILDIVPKDYDAKTIDKTKLVENKERKVFIIANEVMFITKNKHQLISINGNFNILPNELISKVYVNFRKLKSIDLHELEDFLELSKDETAIKAFYKLGTFFTAKKYEINNNIFNLIKHQEEAESVAKKVLLKKMVAWEIRK